MAKTNYSSWRCNGKFHTWFCALHDDNVCNYVNHINSSNNLLVNFTLGNYQLTQTDNFKSKNSDTSLIWLM